MRLTSGQIRDLIARGETFRLECKKASGGLPSTLWPSYSAFSNSDGGVILLGVAEKDGTFEVCGVPDADKLIRDFWNAVNNSECVSYSIFFDHYVSAVDCDGKSVVVIEVPRAPREARPVYVGSDVFKGTYRRNGEGDYRCGREAVKAMLRDQCAETADTCVLDELTVTDLNADTVSRYRRRFANLKGGHVWSDLPDDEFLTKIGAAARGRNGKVHPTLAGLVCFGDFVTITNVLPNYFLDYREPSDDENRWHDRVCAHDATWSGNIYDFFFRIYDRMTADVKVPFKIASDGITRIDDTPVHKALREALANTLIHADYHGRQGIVIEKRKGEVRFANPGSFLLKREEAIAGGRSEARNSRIFNIFALLDIGERSGMGLSNLFGVWEKMGERTPILIETSEPDRVELIVPIERIDGSVQKSGCKQGGPKAGHIGPKVGQAGPKLGQTGTEGGPNQNKEKILMALNASTRLVYHSLCEDVGLTHRALAKKLDLSRTTIAKATSELVEMGFIRRMGSRRGSHWEVLKED